MRAVLLFALAAVLLFAGPSLDGGGTIQPLAAGRAIAAAGGDNVPFVLPIGDVVHFMSPTGKDSANGRTPATAWATANHRVNCGDVIIAEPGIYGQLSGWGPVSKCPSISGGVDGTGGIYFAVLLCAGPNLGTCNVSGGGTNNAIDVNKNNWAVEGFNASAPGAGQAFFADACNTSAVLHHVAFINDVATNSGYGFDAGHCGNRFGNDYVAFVGSIAQNSNAYTGGASFCGSAVDVNAPQNFDTNAGTHIFVHGMFMFANLGPTPVSGCTSDIEPLMFDTWDGFAYTQQGIASDNLIWHNGGFGIHIFYQAKQRCNADDSLRPQHSVRQLRQRSRRNVQLFRNELRNQQRSVEHFRNEQHPSYWKGNGCGRKSSVRDQLRHHSRFDVIPSNTYG